MLEGHKERLREQFLQLYPDGMKERAKFDPEKLGERPERAMVKQDMLTWDMRKPPVWVS